MRTRPELDDATATALLAGRSVDGDLSELASFVADVRAAAHGDVKPSAELTAVFAEGLEFQPSRAPARRPHQRRTKKMLETALAKLAALGLASKLGIATAAAATAVTGAGAAGVLPAAMQGAVADAVAAVTPFEFPDSAADSAAFGERVANDATDGGVDGPTIAEEASQGRAGGDAAEDARAQGEAAKADALQRRDNAAGAGGGRVPEQAPPADVPRADTPTQADEGIETGKTAQESRPLSPPQPDTTTSDSTADDTGTQKAARSGAGEDAATSGAGNADRARP